MHEARAAKWQTILREVAIIVAGVLCALAGQAWWQNRQDRARGDEYVRQLLTDTRENEQRLDGAITQDSLTRAVLARMATAVYSAGSPPTADSIVAWLRGGALGASEFEPLTGSYGAIMASGDLRLIRTDSLRRRLVAYTAMLQSDDAMLRFYLSQAFGNPGDLARALPFINGSMFADSEPAAVAYARASGFRFDRLRDNGEFSGVMLALRAANGNRLIHLRMLRDETLRLRRALEAESPDSVPAR